MANFPLFMKYYLICSCKFLGLKSNKKKREKEKVKQETESHSQTGMCNVEGEIRLNFVDLDVQYIHNQKCTFLSIKIQSNCIEGVNRIKSCHHIHQ